MVRPLLALCKNDDGLHKDYLAVCQITMTGETPQAPEWVQLIPAGNEVKARDGRKFKNPSPSAVIDAFRVNGLHLPIDLEHATELKAPKGEPAPAVGWIVGLEERAGSIWGRVDWTKAGASMVTNKEYKYISPGFYHTKQGDIVSLSSAGLTNKPALELQALAREELHPEDAMDPKLLKLLGLDDKATPEQVLAACSALKADGLEASTKLTALETEAKVAADKAAAALAEAAKEVATARAQVPGLDKFIPRADYDLAITRIKTLEEDSAKAHKAALDASIDAVIDTALKQAKITPATVSFYRAQCEREGGLALFHEFLKVAPNVLPVDEIVTGKPPETDKLALTSEQRKFCASMGLTEEQFRAGAN
jgi:phage I-like protein